MNPRARNASRNAAAQEPVPRATELSRQLLQAQEEERARISRELHDETGQALMVLRFQLETLAHDNHDPENSAKIHEAIEVLDRTIEGLRRTIARLSPRLLQEFGLIAAVRRQAQLLAKHTSIEPHLELPEKLAPMDDDVQLALYRSVQEALLNVAKHSHANNFTVALSTSSGAASLRVKDDGIGFTPRNAYERGFGLTGMQERAAALGGKMKLRSQPGKGTQIEISLPAIVKPVDLDAHTDRTLRQVS